MLRRVALVVVVAACAVSHVDARAASLRDLVRRGPLGPAGNLTVPAAWAGIWSFTDSSHVCGQAFTDPPQAGDDTLCTGDYIGPVDNGTFSWDCTGDVDDTTAHVTCTASYPLFIGCVVSFTYTLDATRSGETYVSTTTLSTMYSPPMCAFQADTCMETVRHATRTAGPPSECASPVQPTTWGAVKALYR